ncbi:oxalate decarboxylase [Fusarium langsethiae]|uniref:Oxalate decarboxylase n=1 Tax=Fusarium langsethiae TaxID=179993 RepID=A0A0N0V6G4_FUSLA|nr:oxalate decarboxylase [Fusarium langsethiae]GKU03846.1 unnamed protein product [Fusarium langsethiae]GKU22444.1 unnamed protein product [Fusarium langsethiae]
MKGASFLSSALALCLGTSLVAAAPKDAQQPGFAKGQPYDGKGKGSVLLGGTNEELDLQNPDNLGRQSTDNGVVPNLKWSFSDSKTRLLKGGWVREQVIQDLPSSHDISGAQQHLVKGAIRELHWHRVAEWGFVYNGSVLVSAVDEHGRYQEEVLNYGDIWYFPKGAAHTIQGLADENEYLLVFDEADFDKVGPNPYILNAEISKKNVTDGPAGTLSGNSSFVYRTLQHEPEKIGGTGGKFWKIDSTNFPASKTLAATFVTLRPGGLRELHWHPNAEEWLYFHQGTAKATVFIGTAAARTFDFSAGDTAAFPDNSGHYIENTSEDEDLIWIEVYKSDRVADISLTQWLALTPPKVVAQTLNVSIIFVESLKKEKQVLIE